MEENRYMAKMRVHELAKELNIKSQEVIDTLNGTQFAVKNVQSVQVKPIPKLLQHYLISYTVKIMI